MRRAGAFPLGQPPGVSIGLALIARPEPKEFLADLAPSTGLVGERV